MAGLSTKYGFGEYNKSRAEQKREINVGGNTLGQYARNIPNNAPDVVPQQAQQKAPMQAPGVNDMPDKSLYTKTPEQMRQNAVAEKAQAQQREVQRQQSAVEKFNTQQPAEKDPQGVERPTNPKDIADIQYGKRFDPVSMVRPDANVVRDDINRDIEAQEVERKHGWRDWFRNTGDEEFENRKRERIAAFSDMIRHLANLHYVNQYATPQHIESAYGKVKAEEKEERKLRREQEKEDRKWNWKVSEAQRDQANKDRTYGLGVRKDKRAEELQPYKKAEADKKAKRAEYQAQKAALDVEWAPKINSAKEQKERAAASLNLEKKKTERSKQAANNALAAQRRAKAANERDNKSVHFPTNDVNYLWAVNKNDVKVIFTRLRSFAKGRKWAKGYVDEFGNLKKGATDSDLLNAAMGNAHDPEVQRFLNTYGKRVRSEYNEEQDYQLK